MVDDDLGEFSYRIEGRSSLPTVSENLNWTCRATGSVDKSLRINFTNILRDKAVSALGSHLIAAAAEIQQQQQHASFTTATIAENGSNDANQSINTTPMANFRELYQFSAGPLRYRVHINCIKKMLVPGMACLKMLYCFSSRSIMLPNTLKVRLK